MTKLPNRRLNIRDLDNLSQKELYEIAFKKRDMLRKRRERFEKAYKASPGEYSPFGLYELREGVRDEGTVRERTTGIPRVNKKMNRNELKSLILNYSELEHMKTGTLRGAKKHQNEMIRRMLGLPIEGKLNAKDQKRFREGKQAVIDNPQGVSDFWKAFDYYQGEVMYKMLDSERELEDFRPTFEKVKKESNGYNDITELFGKINSVVRNEYEQMQRERRELEDIGGLRRGGWR